MKKIHATQLIILLITIFLPSILHAQPPDFGGDDVNDVPLDGGLSLLIAAGVGYGAKKMRRKKTTSIKTIH